MSAVLSVEGASRRFGEVQALDGVSLEVAAGEVVGLLGPNGSGKSTLIRSVVTLEQLDSGGIRIGGTDAVADPAEARGHVGYAGQEQALDKVLTGREFLRFQAGLVHLPRARIAGRVDELVRRFGLEEAADRPTEGYSGGMKRRLDLAASLMHEPALLVLDEPSAGLDYEARHRLWDVLLDLRKEGTALLAATHDFEEADVLCDRILLMSRGKVAAEGTPAGLRAELGSWVLSAALHEHPHPGDLERLNGLLGGLPGRPLPADPARASLDWVPEEGEADLAEGERLVREVRERAVRAGLGLFSVAVRHPTLEDVYRQSVGRLEEEAP